MTALTIKIEEVYIGTANHRPVHLSMVRELEHSIREKGVERPILVQIRERAHGSFKYNLRDGLHKIIACKNLRITDIPALVQD